ncbi:heavy metal translocating P-type ATPase [Alcanivorax sp. DP30]|uniref:heavy metal translocating P-type ATPase n=1 Tax=Alcanivorax sp. DP30 TaxID=2606217 RepID=UPI0013713200|nr:heavy metal translocating P-type ATPase [Alcanivorax sp. DP30]MZR61773.1 cadmium-translocating P-type ATPase [Alcanivorax sp. DP30]
MTDSCWHCGNPAPAGAFQARTPEGSRDACCPGCAAAIETIYGLGLDDYYTVRESQAPVPDETRTALNRALFRVPELVAPHLTDLPDGQRLRLQLGGLTCAACSWLIEKAVREQPGVKAATVNLAGMTLLVDYQGVADAEATADRVLRLGYSVTLPGDPAQSQQQKREQRRLVGRLALAGLGAMQAMMYATALYIGAFEGRDAVYEWVFRIASLLVATPVVFYSGWPFFQGAWLGLKKARLTMDVPIALALLLAWGGSIAVMANGGRHVYFDSAAMFVFFLLTSRWLEQRQRRAIHESYQHLGATLPQAVRRLDDHDQPVWISVRQVASGDRLQLIQGDTVPVDGSILDGEAALDESAFTGESLPVQRQRGDSVHAGTRVVEGGLVVEAAGTAANSLMAQIGEQVDRAQQERVEVVRDWQQVAPLFTTAVLLLAAFTMAWHWSSGPAVAFEHTLAVLVVTCPCALALAVPLTLSATLGSALKNGVLVASPRQLLKLPAVRGAIFDKTGTLTTGQFRIVESRLAGGSGDNPDKDVLLAIAAALEWQNPHPLARPFQSIPRDPGVNQIRTSGNGVQGQRDGCLWRITGDPGSARDGMTSLALFCDEQLMLQLWLEDALRDESATVVSRLADKGITSRMATGDNAESAGKVAGATGIREWRAGMTPQAKQQWVEELEADAPQMIVGDGINDANAMLSASVSVATANATSLTQRAAGLYLLQDKLDATPALPDLARFCQRLIRQNLTWALLYNVLAVPFAVAGLIPPWAAAIGMSASSLLVTFNASRISRWKLSSS